MRHTAVWKIWDYGCALKVVMAMNFFVVFSCFNQPLCALIECHDLTMHISTAFSWCFNYEYSMGNVP